MFEERIGALLQQERLRLGARLLLLSRLPSDEGLAIAVTAAGWRSVNASSYAWPAVSSRRTPEVWTATRRADPTEPDLLIATIADEPFGLAIEWDRRRSPPTDPVTTVDPALAALIVEWVQQSRYALTCMVAVIDALDMCAFLTTRSGQVVGRSDRAARLVDRRGALGVRHDRLRAADAEQQASLMAALGTACAREREGQRSLALRSGGESLAIDIKPVSQDQPSLYGVCAVVVVRQAPTKSAGEQLDLLRNIFALTDAEARLALDLASGASLAVIAERQMLSRETLRSRLKRIFQKTGASRQAELVAKLQSKIGNVGAERFSSDVSEF